ncbi:MAG: tetratricopeptide repeat protein [bacterium]
MRNRTKQSITEFLSICLVLILLQLEEVFPQLNENPYEYCSEQINDVSQLFDKLLIRKAEQKLIETIKSNPDNSSSDKAVILSANLDYLTKNYKLADSKLNEFIKQRSNSPLKTLAAVLRGYIAFEQKKYNKATEYFAESKKIAETDFNLRSDSIYRNITHNSLFWGAVSLCHQGKYQEAKPLFEECFRFYPEQEYADDALYLLGVSEEINRNFEIAISYYNTIAKKYPYRNTYMASRIREINNKLILREPFTALDILENVKNTAIKISMQNSIGKLYEPQSHINNAEADLQYLSGEALNIAGKYEQALIEFKTFLDNYSNPELDEYVRLGSGWALLNLGRNKEAIEFYDIIINTEKPFNQKNKAAAQMYRTIALKRSGNTEQAAKEISALSIQPAYPFLGQVLMELGQIYYESGKFDDCRRTLERAQREATEGIVSVRIALLLGATFIEQRNWEKSVIEYSKAEQIALRSSPNFMPQKDWYLAESRLKRGIALVLSHRNAEAITVLNTFIGNNKNDKRLDEALFWLAEAYYRSDLLKNSAETYTNLLQQYPASPRKEEALYGQGWSYFRLQQFKKSSEIFNKMAKDYPRSKYAMEVLARQADGYYIMKDYKNASESYRKAMNFSPKSDEGQYCAYQLSHALYRLGEFEPAISSLLNFVRNYPRSAYAPYSLYLIGWIRFQQKDYKEAIDNFRFLIQAYSQHDLVVRAYYAIGDAHYNSGNYEAAIESYNNVVRQFPSDALAPEAWRSLQFCYMALGREQEAILIADSVISSHPNTPFAQELFIKKADMFFSGMRFKDAVDEYQNFIKAYPDSKRNSEALYWMGKSYINLNDNENAIDAFNTLEKKYPDSEFAPMGMLEHGLLMKKLNDINKADSIFKNLEKKYPEDQNSAQAGFERAVIKHELGDTLTAMKLYREVAERYKGMEYADQSRYRIAGYYRSKGMYDSARIEYGKIASSMSDIALAAESQFRIGEMWMRDTSWVNAAEALNIVRDKFPGVETWYPLSLLNLGEVYEKLGEIGKAKEIYQALLTQRPDDEYGKTVKLRLKRLEKK